MKQNDLMKTQNSFTLIKAVNLQRLLTALKSDFPQGRWHGSTNTGRLTARSNTHACCQIETITAEWEHCHSMEMVTLKCNENWRAQVFLMYWSEFVAGDL